MPQDLESCDATLLYCHHCFLTSHIPVWTVAISGMTFKCLKLGISSRWSRRVIQWLKTPKSVNVGLTLHVDGSTAISSSATLSKHSVPSVSDLWHADDKPSLALWGLAQDLKMLQQPFIHEDWNSTVFTLVVFAWLTLCAALADSNGLLVHYFGNLHALTSVRL